MRGAAGAMRLVRACPGPPEAVMTEEGTVHFVCTEFDGCTYHRCEYEGEDECHWLNIPVDVCFCPQCAYVREHGRTPPPPQIRRCPNCGGPVMRDEVDEDGYQLVTCTVNWCGWHVRVRTIFGEGLTP